MNEYIQVTDDTFDDLLTAEQAVLVVGKSDCEYCRRYDTGITRLADDPAYADVVFGKVVLDKPGSIEVKRRNGWIAGLTQLPYTVLYRRGEPVDKFAASKAEYLEERLREAFLRPAE